MSYGEQLKESQPALKAFVKSKIYNNADALDIVQNVNEVALNKADSYEDGRSFEAWVIGIAKYQILNHLKKNKKTPTHFSLDKHSDDGMFFEENTGAFLDDIPFANLVLEERQELESQILGILTSNQKKIFKLLCLGKSRKEIALELETSEINVTTTKSRLIKRAKTYIRKLNLLNGYDYRSRRQ